MTDCERCGKPLKAIGTARKNGKKTHNDWDTRQLHKRCWLEERKFNDTMNMLNFTGKFEFSKTESFRDNLLNKILGN